MLIQLGKHPYNPGKDPRSKPFIANFYLTKLLN